MALSPVTSVQLTPAFGSPAGFSLDNSRCSSRASGRKVLVPIDAKNKSSPLTLSSDYLPEELLVALLEPAPVPERLGPPTRLPNLNVSTVATRKAAANVWSYPKQREKLKHLLAGPPCVCGAGRDISFLYDVPKKKEAASSAMKPDQFDASKVRALEVHIEERKSFIPPETIIPEEYHIVKNKAAQQLESYNDQYTAIPEDHDKHLVLFPSMNPASRFEVLQLREVLNDMLEKCGVNADFDELAAPTQMHRLLELIKKEQNIYNIIFHELIRQVSIECVERGELLATVRSRYADLLSRVPEQIKSLHDEVLAQRALDRRLTEELDRFKTTVSVLTSELNAVKEHDRQVTQQALKVQEDLKSALNEATKNSNMLVEYRELYELQRRRLEKNVEELSGELQTWCDVSYTLAGKVIEEHCLNSTRRLCVSERAWSRLADHFAIALSERDMADMMSVQLNVDGWSAALDDFDRDIRLSEDDMRHNLRLVVDELQRWLKAFGSAADTQQAGDPQKTKKVFKLPANRFPVLVADVKNWEQTLAYVADKFGGESVLASQEVLANLRRYISGWTNSALRVFLRHDEGAGQHPAHTEMINVNHEVDALLKQYSDRITGENGVVDSVQLVTNGIESWSQRFVAPPLSDAVSLSESLAAVLVEQMEFWVTALGDAIANIGSLQRPENARRTESVCDLAAVEKSDVVRHVQKWLKTAQHSIDSTDAKIIERARVMHREMVHWMTHSLISLVPTLRVQSNEAREAELLRTVSVEHLFDEARTLSLTVNEFTRLLSRHCSHFVSMERQLRQDRNDPSADHEHHELVRFTTECEDWIKMTSVVLNELAATHPLDLTTDPLPSLDVLRREGTMGPDSRIATPQRDDSKLSATSRVNTPGEHTEQVNETENHRDDVTEPRLQTPGQVKSSIDGKPEPLPTPGTEAGTQAEVLEVGTIEAEGSQVPPEIVIDSELQPQLIDAGASLDRQPSMDHLEIIGYDSSTRTVSLTPPPHVDGQPDDASQSAGYTAFSSIQTLQQQLLETESRAQEAEERAMAAEAALVDALEKLRGFERGGRISVTPITETPPLSAAPSELSLATPSVTKTSRAATPTSTASLSVREKSGVSTHRSSAATKSKGKKK